MTARRRREPTEAELHRIDKFLAIALVVGSAALGFGATILVIGWLQ